MRTGYDITIRQGIEVPNQGIEVVPYPGIEVVPNPGIEVVPNQDTIPYRHDDAEKLNTPQVPVENRRLCGLSFVWFWAWIVIIAFVLFGAAIGGGVGAGLAAQRKDIPNAASDHSARQVSDSYAPQTFAHHRSGAV